MTTTLHPNLFTALAQSDFATFDDSVDQLELTGEIIVVEANKWVETRETILIGNEEVSLNVRYRFIDPILSSIILRSTVTSNNPDGRIDFNATIVANREMEVQINDDWVSMAQFAVMAIKAASASAKNLSDETILHTLASYGWDQSGKNTIYLQHLGAGISEFDQIAEHFVSMGATNNTQSVKQRSQGTSSTVIAAFRHPNGGIPVAAMEISKADRSKSQTNTGFIGFLDASWGTLTKVMKAHRTRIALDAIIKNPDSTDEQRHAAAAQETQIRNLFQVAVAARAFRNWGGTTEVVNPIDENAPSKFYAQQVPCGRLYVNAGGDKVAYSVWTNANQAITAPLPVANLNEVLPDLGEPTTF